MSEQPYMQLWIADYIGDTLHLTAEQHGAYLLLLMAMWRSGGSLPRDDTKLARIARVTVSRWKKVCSEVMEFFDESDGAITQKRLTVELQKAREKSVIRSEAGRAGAEAKALKNNKPTLAKAKANGQAKVKHSPEPEPLATIVAKNIEPSSLSILKTTLDDETAEAVIEYRKRKKFSIAPIALRRLANQLAKWPRPNEAAAEMIMRDWRGFDPVWMDRGNGRSNGQAPPKTSYADELHRIREDMEREADERENGNRDRGFKAATAPDCGRH